MKKIAYFTIILTLIVIGVFFTATLNAGNVPRITKKQLKGMFGDSDLIILDARAGKDWKASEFKIQGAERAEPRDFNSWATKYPKDKSVVLYCA